MGATGSRQLAVHSICLPPGVEKDARPLLVRGTARGILAGRQIAVPQNDLQEPGALILTGLLGV